jgi:hypothetical protein
MSWASGSAAAPPKALQTNQESSDAVSSLMAGKLCRTVTEVAKDGLVMPCVPRALYERGKSRRKGLPENGGNSGVCITIIRVARGLPQALAAVRDCASTAPISGSETKEVWPRLATAVH